MEFCIKKSVMLIMKKGKRETTEGIDLPIRKTKENLGKKRKLQLPRYTGSGLLPNRDERKSKILDTILRWLWKEER